MYDLMHINNWDTRVAFQKRLEEEGSVGKDQIKLSKLEDDSYAIDIYDPELYECETGLYVSEKEAREDYDSLIRHGQVKDNKLYNIPCSWTMYGHAEVRADSLEEATNIAESDQTALPRSGSYVDGSFEIDHDMLNDSYLCSECGLEEIADGDAVCKECQNEIDRRDEKNGLYPDKQDISN